VEVSALEWDTLGELSTKEEDESRLWRKRQESKNTGVQISQEQNKEYLLSYQKGRNKGHL
jgi:hypothetical protein